MRLELFREWLSVRYAGGTVATQSSTARRLETAYGDLDQLYDEDKYESLLAELEYSKADEAARRPNPSKLEIDGNIFNTLSSCRTALRTYRNFRDDPGTSSVASENAIELAGELIRERKEGRLFEIERHLQASLRREIDQLEPGLRIIDGGLERGVESGLIDITAEDAEGAVVAIELKRGKATREAIGQLIGYMGDLAGEEPNTRVRGILVAAEFDQSCLSARNIMANVALVSYRFDFVFTKV